MIEVYETKKVPENCSTCLYQSENLFMICGNANVSKETAFRYALFGGCPYYWLNQHKYRKVEKEW